MALYGAGAYGMYHYSGEMNEAAGGGPGGTYDPQRFQQAQAGFNTSTGVAAAGLSIAAAPFVATVGGQLAAFGGWSSTGYAAAAWTAAIDMGAGGALMNGTQAYASGARASEVAWATYTGGRNGFAAGLGLGPAFHGAGQLLGRAGRYADDAIAGRLDPAVKRRAYLNAKFGRTGNLHADINARGAAEAMHSPWNRLVWCMRIYTFAYQYDFGDNWQHEIVFEGCLRAEKGSRYPLCVEGACPPEDVGGFMGYEVYLEALADPRHEEHRMYLEWRGPFDPEAFSAEKTTKAMRRGLLNRRDDE